MEQLLDPASAFGRNSTGLNVCLIRPSDWSPAGSSPDDTRETLRLFAEAASEFIAEHSGHLLVCLCPDPSGDEMVPALDALTDDLSGTAGVAVVSAQDWFQAYAVADPFDPYAQELAHLPFTDLAFAAIALGLARVVRSLNAKPRKVIAVDCDDTLWGGACGDLDPAELVIDDRFRGVQRFLLDRFHHGFMLVICSRNDPASVERVFAERAADLVLAPEHFVTRQVNWRPKWENLNAMAAQLGVGVDSFVLVDDDPLVCVLTGDALPATGVVHLPVAADPLPILLRQADFDRFFVTDEDRRRNDTYRADELRARERAGTATLAELNRRLGTEISVVRANRSHWRRIEQLAARTNQFTCATMTPAEVGAALRGGAPAWVVSLRDRFGEYGVVAAALAHPGDGEFRLDTLMMSCRALHRGVAEALLDTVLAEAHRRGHAEVRARLRPTGRNQLARDFLTDRAVRVDDDADGHLVILLARDERTALEGAVG
jgi:FkbH-like protein